MTQTGMGSRFRCDFERTQGKDDGNEKEKKPHSVALLYAVKSVTVSLKFSGEIQVYLRRATARS
jgi:hypothetical protein